MVHICNASAQGMWPLCRTLSKKDKVIKGMASNQRNKVKDRVHLFAEEDRFLYGPQDAGGLLNQGNWQVDARVRIVHLHVGSTR